MKNNSYWVKRKAQMMYKDMEIAEKAADETARLYINASNYIEKKLTEIFGKCKNSVQLNKSDVLKIIESANSKSIEEIINIAKARGMKELTDYLEQPDTRRQYRRLTEMEGQIDGLINNLYQSEKATVNKALGKISSDSYYRSVFEVQKQTGLGFSFHKFDQKLFEKIVNSKWSGDNYSKRIWKRTQKLADTLKSEMLQGFMCGKTYKEMAEVVEDQFSASAINARRLVRTEGNFVSNEFQMQSYDECDIEKYIFVATLDLRTSEVCASLDGKVFNVSEAVPGKNMPPLHPYCRSTTIPYVDEVTLASMKRRARNPTTGKNEIVPADMTYQEWYRKYVQDDSAKDRLGLITNNNKSNNRYYDYKNKPLMQVEQEISGLDYEVAVGYNSKGKAVFCQLQEGAEHEVKFTRYQYAKMKDADITHNHIYGTPPSPEDLYLMVKNQAHSIRACSKRGTYTILNGDYIQNLPDDFKVFNAEYEEIYDSLMQKYSELIHNTKMNAIEAEIALQDEIWDELKNRYNIDMKFEVEK